MKRAQLSFRKEFRVTIGNRNSQAAEMVLAPADAEGDPSNRHRGADQWLFILERGAWPAEDAERVRAARVSQERRSVAARKKMKLRFLAA
jgi:hypothetical protein